ncbi:MAG: hypothetical protein HY096_04545 [Nitrospinae bacterium]|nr:hypothetical protein [Nitrospinota bacterium]
MQKILFFIKLFVIIIFITIDSNSFANQQDEKQTFINDTLQKVSMFHDLSESLGKNLNLRELPNCIAENRKDRFCNILEAYIDGFDTSKIFHIKLYRYHLNDKCIIGYLTANNIVMSYSLELPWKNNSKDVSSIPAGTYYGYLRYNHEDKWRIELLDVPKRDNIQIHTGNTVYPKPPKTKPDTIGCILIGKKVDINSCEIEAGTSQPASKELKTALYSNENMCLDGSKRTIILTIVDNYCPMLESKN